MEQITYNGENITTTFRQGRWVHPETGVKYPSNWNDPIDGVTFETVPDPEPEPAPAQTTFTPLEFLEKFTEAEQLAVVSATMTNPQVKLWYDKLLSALDADLTDPRLIAGMNALVGFGLLTQSRVNEILEI